MVIVLNVLDVKEADFIQGVHFGTETNLPLTLNRVGFVRGMLFSYHSATSSRTT